MNGITRVSDVPLRCSIRKPTDPREQDVTHAPDVPLPSHLLPPKDSAAQIQAHARDRVRRHRDAQLRAAAPELLRLVRFFVHACQRAKFDPLDTEYRSLVEQGEQLIAHLDGKS